MNANSVAHTPLEIQLRDGEPRCYDLDLAERLGFDRPRKIRDLIKRHLSSLDELGPRSTVGRVVNGGDATEYYLNRKQALFITTKSDTVRAIEATIDIVKRFDEYEMGARAAPTIPTTAEAFASAFMMIAQQERQQAAQQRALQQLDQRIERVETSHSVLSARPTNAESITHLRSRIGKMFGLSAAVIDEVMRQSPYAPKPAGMVKNDHVDADGVPYAIYWRKDVTATFSRFVGECTPVTATMFTHPFITGRFRIVGKAVAA